MSAIQLGAFEVWENIASGGMGDIWRGAHVAQDVPVAIKVLRRTSAQDEEFRALFRREVRAAARLDHPGIITVFDIGEVPEEAASASGGGLTPQSPYLVMEYLERGSLESLTYPLPWPVTREMLLAILDGLAHAHARGITHRDLKPGNVLLADPSTGSPIRLTDFGIAFSYGEGPWTETEGTISGTPMYMAPEQFMGAWRDFGPWTDLYAVGCIAYQLASGRVPFRQLDLMHLAMAHIEDPPPVLQCPPDYPAGFAAWVLRLLAKEPAHRYRRAADAAAALASLSPLAEVELQEFKTTTWALPAPGDADAPPQWRAPLPPQRSFRLIGAGLRLFGLRTVPLVDRADECDQLWAMFRGMAEVGKPGLVALEGPAGTGKSRLAEWLYERTHELGLAECFKAEHNRSRGREAVLSHMVAAAWSCLGIEPTDLQDRVAAILSSAGVETPVAQHAMAEFLAPAALGSDYSPGMFHEFPSRSARFKSLFEALRHVYDQRPLVMWLDDVHWGVDALHFVRYVLERAETDPLRMLAVVTVRDDLLVESPEASSLLRELCAEHAALCMRVSPLSDGDSRQLVGNLLHLEGDLAEQVSVRSGGNPLYATQLVDDWIDRGVLEAGERGFVLAGSEFPDVPDDVHALWIQRLDRVLDEAAAFTGRTSGAFAARMQVQVLLELAAALGRRIDMAEWLSLCSLAGVPDPSPVLEPLAASRLVQLDANGWAFSHNMLCDSIERIARERRRWAAHNRLCADMLEQRRPVPHWGDSERIGRHRFEATQFDSAALPLLRGARERTRLEEYSAALALLSLHDRALDELGRPDEDPRRLEGWLLRADIHCTREELHTAEALAARAHRLADSPDRERFAGAALLVSARVHQRQGRLYTALDEYEQAQRLLRNAGATQTLAVCLSEQANTMLEAGRLDRAWEALHEAQELYEDSGQLVPWAENQLGQARVAVHQGQVDQARALCRRVQAFGRREELNRIEAAAWAVLSEVDVVDGRPTEAVRALDESIALVEELGLGRQALRLRSLKVLLLLESGSEDQARGEYARLKGTPEVELPRLVRLLMRGVGLAIGVDGPDTEFESIFHQVAALLTGIEAVPQDVDRCLRLAIGRARMLGVAHRAARIEELAATIVAHESRDGLDVERL
ncbi:MAG: protein kinase [Gemmatimonadales bacterium]|jgi:serine/threonine protein kinase/tetratricopeptide (TPR) repeat protein